MHILAVVIEIIDDMAPYLHIQWSSCRLCICVNTSYVLLASFPIGALKQKFNTFPFLAWQHNAITNIYSISMCNRYGIFMPQMKTDAFVVLKILSFPHLWVIIMFETIVLQRVPHVEPELVTLQEHLSSSRFMPFDHKVFT